MAVAHLVAAAPALGVAWHSKQSELNGGLTKLVVLPNDAAPRGCGSLSVAICLDHRDAISSEVVRQRLWDTGLLPAGGGRRPGVSTGR